MKNKLLSILLSALLFAAFAFLTSFEIKEEPKYDDYNGKYKMVVDPNIIITILHENKKLVLQISLNGDAKYDLIPVKGEKETFERFENGKSVNKIIFQRGKTGIVTHLMLIEGGQFRADKIVE